MIRAMRTVATTAVAVAGVAALLATSQPPPPRLDLSAHPGEVCRGEPVTLSWALQPGDGPPFGVEDLRWATVPDGNLDPAIAGTPLDASGSLVVVPRAPVYVGVTQPENSNLWWSPVGIDAIDCAALGFQTPFGSLRLTSVQSDPGSDALLGVAPDFAPAPMSRLLRWDPTLAEDPPVDLAGYALALAVASDGRVAVAGFERTDLSAAADAFLALLAPDGTELWRARLDAAQAPSGAEAVAFAPDGDLLLAGNRSGGAWREGFVQRYADDGTLRWDHAIAADDNVFATSVAVASDGRAFVAGRTRALLAGAAVEGDPGAFVQAVSSEGDALWTAQRELAGVPGTIFVATPVVAHLTGDRVLLMAQELTAFEADGVVAWSREPAAGDTWVVLAPDRTGGAFVAAAREVTTTFPGHLAQEHRVDVALFRLAADGRGVGAVHLLGSLGDEVVEGLAAWPSAGPGGVALTGTTSGALMAPRSGSSAQSKDTFLLVLNDDGPVPAAVD